MRFGVVGSGDAGWSFAGAAHFVEGVELIGVAGRTAEKVAKLAEKALTRGFSFEELLAQKPDVVAIATPPGVHSPQALACLRAGIHVMIEKPMALSVEDCDRVIGEAQKRGRKIMVTQTWRYRDIIRKAREIIASGRFGTVTNVYLENSHNYFSSKRSGWQVDVEMSGGGVTMNPFIHFIDTARYLAGAEVTDVRGMVGFHKEGFEKIEGDVTCVARFANGATAMICVNGYGQQPSDKTEVYLTQGVLRINATEKRIDAVINGRVAECYGFGENGLTNAQGIYGHLGYIRHIEEMRDAVEKGGPISSDGANGRENVRIARGILESCGVKMPGPSVTE